MKRKLQSTEGATMVEFAIIATLFLLLIFGIFEGGRVFNSWLLITNEAREGSRWGVVRVGDPDYEDLGLLRTAVEDHVVARTAGALDQDPAVFGVAATVTEEIVSVRIDYKVPIIVPLVSAVWPDFPLKAVSTMRAE